MSVDNDCDWSSFFYVLQTVLILTLGHSVVYSAREEFYAWFNTGAEY